MIVLPPRQTTADRQHHLYVASWIYVFGATIAAFIVLVSGVAG